MKLYKIYYDENKNYTYTNMSVDDVDTPNKYLEIYGLRFIYGIDILTIIIDIEHVISKRYEGHYKYDFYKEILLKMIRNDKINILIENGTL